MHYFTMKISNKRELQLMALNHSFDTEFKDFMKHYKEPFSKETTKEPFSFLINGTTFITKFTKSTKFTIKYYMLLRLINLMLTY